MGFLTWCLCLFFGLYCADKYDTNITYRVYDSNAANSMYTWQFGKEDFSKLTCATTGNLSYIFTGFSEKETASWLDPLIANIKSTRSGCIVVVDYWKYTNVELTKYPEVVLHYDGIEKSVSKEVLAFNVKGFTAANTYFFGFSFGGQVALGVGRSVSSKMGLVNQVHVCEPTSIGFPVTKDSKLSGTNVQCIHTNSLFFGTMKRDCHQDWNMGNCGMYQNPAVNITSHLQCPLFYNSAFKNSFKAIAKPDECKLMATLGTYQDGYKMGLNEPTINKGEFYAKTSILPPYTG